ncbi:MAG: ATP-dependent Clp protease proteolytic subunit 1 [Pirellulaceae bacterium]|nr:MAG: ATP-dependent Clp protease proteolytic subunit 1 [Pirellulaceae bacterium]
MNRSRPSRLTARGSMRVGPVAASSENITPMNEFLPGPLGTISNSYSYQTYQRQRMMTLGDLLLENRIVFLQGEIYSATANEIVMKLLYLQSENRRKEIHFYLNSPGGDVYATLAIYDTMQILSCPVATYCVGQAASGAAVLLAGGAKGKRFALPHSRVMLHQPYGGVSGQVTDIEIQCNEILRARETLNQILAYHTGQSIEKIAADTDRDFYMSAEQAKAYGVVDEILYKPAAVEDDEAER